MEILYCMNSFSSRILRIHRGKSGKSLTRSIQWKGIKWAAPSYLTKITNVYILSLFFIKCVVQCNLQCGKVCSWHWERLSESGQFRLFGEKAKLWILHRFSPEKSGKIPGSSCYFHSFVVSFKCITTPWASFRRRLEIKGKIRIPGHPPGYVESVALAGRKEKDIEREIAELPGAGGTFDPGPGK